MTYSKEMKPEKMKERVIRLGEAINIISGAPFKSELFNDVGNGIPLIRVRDVNTGPAGIFYSGEFSREHLVQTGDLLVSMDGDFKAVRWSYGNGLLNQRVCKVVPNEELLDRRYLEQFLPKALSDIHRETTFTTVKHLSTKTIREIEIPLPPLDDQIRIAHLLSKVEGLIAQRKQNLQQLDDLLKSVFLEMFGDPVRNEKGWENHPCTKVVTDILSGTSYGGEDKEFLDDDEYGVLKISAVTQGSLNSNEFKAVKKSSIIKPLRFIQNGDFLFSRANTIELVAACCIVDGDYPKLFIPDKLWILTFAEFIEPQYFNFLLKNESFRNQVRKSASGGHDSMLNISMKKFHALNIPVPPHKLQQKFTTIVESIEVIKSSYQYSLTELENLYGALSQKAFKGELDLSRVPLVPTKQSIATDSRHMQEQAIPSSASVANITKPIELPVPHNINSLSNVEGRRSVIAQWLDAYLEQIDSRAAFSHENFLEAAQQRLEDLMQDQSPVLDVAAYDHIKQWIFHALGSGRLIQNYDDAGNRVRINSAMS